MKTLDGKQSATCHNKFVDRFLNHGNDEYHRSHYTHLSLCIIDFIRYLTVRLYTQL